MRKIAIASATIVGTLSLVTPAVRACGDNLLTPGRGVRFQRAFAATHPAAILIYTNGALAKESELAEVLKQAGNRVQKASDLASLQQALKSGKFDLILADLSDVAGLAITIQSASSQPTVVPVLYKPDKPAQAAAKQFGTVLKLPGTAGDHVTAIDELMKRRGKLAHT